MCQSDDLQAYNTFVKELEEKIGPLSKRELLITRRAWLVSGIYILEQHLGQIEERLENSSEKHDG